MIDCPSGFVWSLVEYCKILLITTTRTIIMMIGNNNNWAQILGRRAGARVGEISRAACYFLNSPLLALPSPARGQIFCSLSVRSLARSAHSGAASPSARPAVRLSVRLSVCQAPAACCRPARALQQQAKGRLHQSTRRANYYYRPALSLRLARCPCRAAQ